MGCCGFAESIAGPWASASCAAQRACGASGEWGQQKLVDAGVVVEVLEFE